MLVNRFLSLLGHFAVVLDAHRRPNAEWVPFRSTCRSVLDSSVTVLISSTPAAVFSTAHARDPQCVVDTVVYLDDDLLPEDYPTAVRALERLKFV